MQHGAIVFWRSKGPRPGTGQKGTLLCPFLLALKTMVLSLWDFRDPFNMHTGAGTEMV